MGPDTDSRRRAVAPCRVSSGSCPLSANSLILQMVRNNRQVMGRKKTRIQLAPRYSSPSKGAVETHIKLAQGRFRSLRIQVEANYKCRISFTYPIVPWMLRHVEFTLTRFHRKATGRSAHEDAFDETYALPQPSFSEWTVTAGLATEEGASGLSSKHQLWTDGRD